MLLCAFLCTESPQESKYRRTTGYTCFHRAINIQLSIKNIFVYSMLSKIKVNKIKAGCQHAEGLRKRGEIRHQDGIYVFY